MENSDLTSLILVPLQISCESKVLGPRYWILGPLSLVLGYGFQILGPRSWVLFFQILHLGPFSSLFITKGDKWNYKVSEVLQNVTFITKWDIPRDLNTFLIKIIEISRSTIRTARLVPLTRVLSWKLIKCLTDVHNDDCIFEFKLSWFLIIFKNKWLWIKVYCYCCGKCITVWKVSENKVFSGPYFPIFGLNKRKYEPGKTPYLDTFHAVYVLITNCKCQYSDAEFH